MTRQTFNTCFTTLLQAFAYAQERTSPEAQDIYWQMLRGIPDDKFNAGVRACLASCKFFPSIAELGDASLPAITERAPYNPNIYQEPRQVRWQEQVARMEHGHREITDNEKRFLKKFPIPNFSVDK